MATIHGVVGPKPETITVTVTVNLREVLDGMVDPPEMTPKLTEEYADRMESEVCSWFEWGLEKDLLLDMMDKKAEQKLD